MLVLIMAIFIVFGATLSMTHTEQFSVNEILFDNGYVFVRNVSFDTFYIHPSVLKETNIVCEKFEQVPKKNW